MAPLFKDRIGETNYPRCWGQSPPSLPATFPGTIRTNPLPSRPPRDPLWSRFLYERGIPRGLAGGQARSRCFPNADGKHEGAGWGAGCPGSAGQGLGVTLTTAFLWTPHLDIGGRDGQIRGPPGALEARPGPSSSWRDPVWGSRLPSYLRRAACACGPVAHGNSWGPAS